MKNWICRYFNYFILNPFQDSIYPNGAYIKSGKYPYTASYYGIIKSRDTNELGGKFLRCMGSEEGQRCIRQATFLYLNI